MLKSKTTQWIITIIICFFFLASCVNYSAIQSHAQPYDAAALSEHHTYSLNKRTAIIIQSNWWNQFHDSQLNQLITIALTDSPNLQIAQSRIERAQHLAEAAGASLWPSANFDGSVKRELFTATGLVPAPFNGTVNTMGDVGLNFQYEFDFWGKNRQAIAARVSEEQAAEADFAATRLVLSTAIASQYFKLQNNLVQLQLAETIQQQQQTLLNIAKMLARHNIQSDIPIATVAARLDAEKINVAEAKRAVVMARDQLAALLGKNPFTTKIIPNAFHYHKQALAIPTNLPANLLGRRPDIAASRWRVEAMQHKVNSTKALFFPNINLTALYSYQSIGLGMLFRGKSRDIAGQAAIDLPIFDAGLLRATLKTRYAEYDIAVNQYNQTILTALRQTADQLAILQSIHSGLAAQTSLLQASQHRYQLTKARYIHGIDTYTPVLETHIALLKQQRIQAQMQAQHILATIEMIKILGGDYHVVNR